MCVSNQLRISSKEFSSAVAFSEKWLDLCLIINHTLKKHTMKKAKEITTKYGIAIVKPWSQEMYDHNDKVAEQMKDAIYVALSNRYNEDCEDAVREIAVEVTGMRYGFGYTLDGIYEEACAELDRVQNYWLHESYPNLVKKGHCPALSEGFVGY